MENKRAIIWAVGSAVAAVFLYFAAINQAVKNKTKGLDDTLQIVVAKINIPPETRITADMIQGKTVPRQYLPEKVITNVAQVLGQESLVTIFAGDPILQNHVIPFDESALDRRIPPGGYRAVTIGIKDSQDVIGVGGNLRPGMHIDLLVTMFLSTEQIEKGNSPAAQIIAQASNRLKAETRTVFQNVPIIAVGRDARLETANVVRQDLTRVQQTTPKNITVALKPADVQKVVLAQQIGQIMISLRRFNDNEIIDLDYLDPFKAFKIKLPVVQGPPPAYREIRGGQVIASPF